MVYQGQLVKLDGSTTNLGNAESFTSKVDVDEYTGEVTVLVKADQAGTIKVQQSNDNTNWDLEETTAVSANTGTKAVVKKVAKYIRVVYTNSATPQTSFRIGVYARKNVI